MAYVGKAPLTLVRTTTGSSEYVYAGAVAPDGIAADDLERLLDEGYLVEVVAEPEVTPVANDPGTGNLGPDLTVERPKSVATKQVWVDYRVALDQLLEEQADEVTTDQLKDDEFMASFLQSRSAPDAS